MPALAQVSSSGTTPGSALNTGSLERNDRILTLPSVRNGQFDRDGAVAAHGVIEGEGGVMDRPFAGGEIGYAQRCADAQNDKAPLHVVSALLVCGRRCFGVPY